MAEASKTEIIRALFAAYLANDRRAVEALSRTISASPVPYDDGIDKATYFERCWRGTTGSSGRIWKGSWSRARRPLSLIAASQRTERVSATPSSSPSQGGRVRRIDVYFGAT